jgi:molecular chaperone HtpG
MPAKNTKKTGNISITTENIFPIIKKWLYNENDIFIRELIANATDASSKRKIIDENLKDEDLEIEVKIDKKAKTISFIDNGIGMTAEEIEKYINQIAFSGANDFIEQFKDKQNTIIGHFGLGFYSSFMVSEKVTIDSLSHVADSIPAYWECTGEPEFTINKGKRKKIGTTVTLYLNSENEQYLEDGKIRELIEKYCNFMTFPIRFEKDIINQKVALWNKKPNDCSDEDYKNFYRDVFHDYNEPVFWIHLNVDYPFTLKGILYFPKINKYDMELLRGKVKLFCNNVFVADNLKEFIPEFMTMLRGGVDVPDIPLNVSRSFLQNDKQVNQIRKYIMKKISDQFASTFNDDRPRYEKYWDDVQNVVKYGMLTEEDFAENMRKYVIFKTSNSEYTTIEEYLDKNKSTEKPQKIYYSPSENTQVSLLNLIKEQNIDVIFCDSVLDTHILQHFEMKNQDMRFVRIDSEINDLLIEKTDDSENDFNNQLIEKIKKLLENEKIEIIIQKLKAKNIPAMVIYDEFMRRFSEMNAFGKDEKMGILSTYKFVLNKESKTVQKINSLCDEGKEAEARLLVKYIHDLAMIEQRQFNGEELKMFIDNANQLIENFIV